MLHAQKLIEGYGPATVLDALLAGTRTEGAEAPSAASTESGMDGQSAGWIDEPGVAETADGDGEPEPVLPELPAPAVGMDIPSMGLW